MRCERNLRLGLVGAIALMAALGSACEWDATVLRTPAGQLDGSFAVDGGEQVAGEVVGTGFDQYVGLAVYGRLGPLSGVVVSAVVQPDGSFVLTFPPVFVILGQATLELYVDIDGNGVCTLIADAVWTYPVALDQSEFFRIELTSSDLNPSLLGCIGLNL